MYDVFISADMDNIVTSDKTAPGTLLEAGHCCCLTGVGKSAPSSTPPQPPTLATDDSIIHTCLYKYDLVG